MLTPVLWLMHHLILVETFTPSLNAWTSRFEQQFTAGCSCLPMSPRCFSTLVWVMVGSGFWILVQLAGYKNKNFEKLLSVSDPVVWVVAHEPTIKAELQWWSGLTRTAGFWVSNWCKYQLAWKSNLAHVMSQNWLRWAPVKSGYQPNQCI